MDHTFWADEKRELTEIRRALLNPYAGLAWLGLIFWSLLELPPGPAFAGALLGMCLVLLTEIDLRARTLPNILTGLTALLGMLLAPLWWEAALGMLIAYAVFQMVALVSHYWPHHNRRKRQAGLGQGDVKMFAALGAWVMPTGLPLLALLASVLALVYIVATQHPRGKHIPFGPFLAAGGWLVYVYQWQLWSFFGAV